MENKENLINSLVIKLADSTNLSVGELKSQLEIAMYDWSVSKIENTELTCSDGTVTKNLLEYFRIGKLSSNKTHETINQYIRVAEQLCDMIGKELNAITTDDIRYFLVMYKNNFHVSDTTMQSKRLYLSSIFSYLYKNKKICENPMERIDPISCKVKLKTPLSDEEIERIIMGCNDDKRSIAIIYLFLSTGIRVSELCGIKMSDIDFQNRKIKILGKGNKERFVYFDGKTKVRLLDYIHNERPDIEFNENGMCYGIDTHLFTSKDRLHHPLKRGCIEKILHEIGDRCGIPRLHPHLLRATFATNLYVQKSDVNIVARALGHANLNTVNRYVLLTDCQIERLIS